MISSGSPYYQESRWVDNAMRAINDNKIEAILISDLTTSSDSSLGLPTPADIDEDFFQELEKFAVTTSQRNYSLPLKAF